MRRVGKLFALETRWHLFTLLSHVTEHDIDLFQWPRQHLANNVTYWYCNINYQAAVCYAKSQFRFINLPEWSTKYSKIVWSLTSGGYWKVPWASKNSCSFSLSPVSSRAPKLHMMANMNSFSMCESGKRIFSSVFGINPCSRSHAYVRLRVKST